MNQPCTICQHHYSKPEPKKSKDNPVCGKVFCFTGTMTSPRSILMDMVLEGRGFFSNTVTKRVDYLVVGNVGGYPTTKLKKAWEYKTKTISEIDFLKMMEESLECEGK